MTKQTLKNAVLSAGLLALALSASTSLAQVGTASKIPGKRPPSAAAQAASHQAKTPGAPSYSYTVLSYPGSLSTALSGINHGATPSKNEIVGNGGASGQQGFLASVSEKKSTTEKYQALNYPHVSDQVVPIDVNDSGQIVGYYLDSSGVGIGFELSGGKFTTIAVPFAGATLTIPYGINDSGEIVGWWADSSGVAHGFTLIAGVYTSFDYPGAVNTDANDVNNEGEIVGQYIDASNVYHGYLLSGGTYTSIDYPGATFTNTLAINDGGDIVGIYCPNSECESDEAMQGFVLSGGAFTSIVIPGEFATWLMDITNNGTLLGFYVDAAGLSVSFLATP